MNKLHHQLKSRRLALGLKQHDMHLKTGISRQQYQHLESKGNPRLTTLELIAQGLDSEIMLIPKEKLNAVLAILNATESTPMASASAQTITGNPYADDPWHNLLPQDRP